MSSRFLCFRLPTLRFRVSMLLVCLFSLSISLAIFLYWFSSGYWEENLYTQIERRQIILARAAAITFENFFKDRAVELVELAENPAVQNLEESSGRLAMQALIDHVDKMDGLVGEAVRINKDGQVVWSVTVDELHAETKSLVADRDYFIWARDEAIAGQIFVSEPVWARGGPSVGKLIAILATPVYRQGVFDGVVMIPVQLKGLVDRYLLPLIPGQVEAGAAILTRSGQVVGGTMGHAGEKLTESLDESRYQEFADLFLTGKEGCEIHECYFFSDLETEKRVTSYSPTLMPGLRWVVFISTPYEKIEQLVGPLRLLETIGFTASIFIILVVVLVAVFWYRITERRAFVNGYRHAKKRPGPRNG